MAKFDFIYSSGDKTLYGELSQPNGGGDNWSLIIGGYHWGVLILQQGQWTFYGNARSEIYGDDLQILIEMTEQAY